MPDWLTRSPEEHILYDVDVLFGAWPSHPADTDLATVVAHLNRCHIQNALIISTRGALFSDQAGNTETLALTTSYPGSSPPATSHSDQARGAAASGAGERTGSSPPATSQADGGAQADGPPAVDGSSAAPTSPLDSGRGMVSAPVAGEQSPGSLPSATSSADRERVVDSAPAGGGPASGSSPSATSPHDQEHAVASAPDAGAGDVPGSSPSATSPSDEARGVAPAWGAGARAGSSPSATSRLDEERGAAPGSSAGDATGSSPSATSQDVPSDQQPGQQPEVRLIPVGTVDLRDAVNAAEQIDRLWERGIRWLRLFTREQGVVGETPAYRHVVEEAISRGMVLLQDGDPRVFGRVLAGRGAEVVFLDLHGYLLGDFILMAKDEPGFRATTRMLSSPDGIERVVGSVGAEHLVFGSRSPFMDVSPQTLRLRYARITAEERALIAGGNVQRLLEKVS